MYRIDVARKCQTMPIRQLYAQISNSNLICENQFNLFKTFKVISNNYSITKPSPVRRALSLIVPSSTTKLQPTRQFFRTLPFFTTALSQIIEFSIITLKCIQILVKTSNIAT